MKILALDLGKSKSVACILDTTTNRHRFEKVKTVPLGIQDLMELERPDRVALPQQLARGSCHPLPV